MNPIQLSFLLLTGSTCIVPVVCKEKKSKNKPNILFILADDLGCRDLSCMGSKYYENPEY